ncbi:MAG TPA: hypothetical protein VH062_28780 [Polyangiaceae bacterium]|jgi:hypothetical protein|nr:hypothetical protein [Polyangiaceae bacterium]
MTEPATGAPRHAHAWVFVLGAPLAWALQLVLGWLVSAAACCTRLSPPSLSATGARNAELGITAAALLVAITCTVTGARRRRGSIDTRHGGELPDFLASISWLLGLIITLAILWAGVAALVLPVCERGR